MSLNFHMIEIKAPIRLIQVSLQDYICDFVAALDSQSHQGQSLSRVTIFLASEPDRLGPQEGCRRDQV